MERKYFKSVDEAIEALNQIKNIDYLSLDGVDEVSERKFYNNLMNNLMGTKNLKFTEQERKKYKEALKKKGLLSYRQWKDRQPNPDEKMTWKDSVERGSLDAPVNIFSHLLQSEDEKKFEYIRDVVNNEEKSDIGKMWVKNNTKILSKEKEIKQVESQTILEGEKEITKEEGNSIKDKQVINDTAKIKEREQIVSQTIAETEKEMAEEVSKIINEEQPKKAAEKKEQENESKAIKPYKKPSLFKKIRTYGAIITASVLTLFGAGKKIGEYADKVETDKEKAKNESEVDTKALQEEEAAIRDEMFDREKWFNDSLKRLMARSLLENDDEKTEEKKEFVQSSEVYTQTPDANVEETTEANEKAFEEVEEAIEEKKEAEEAQEIAAAEEIEIVIENEVEEKEEEKSEPVIVGVEEDGGTTVVDPTIPSEIDNSEEDTREKIEVEIDFGDEFFVNETSDIDVESQSEVVEEQENIDDTTVSETEAPEEDTSEIVEETETQEQENIDDTTVSEAEVPEEDTSEIVEEAEVQEQESIDDTAVADTETFEEEMSEIEENEDIEHEEHEEHDECDDCHRCEEHEGLDEEEIGDCEECHFCEEHRVNVYGDYESLTFEEDRDFLEELDLEEQLVEDLEEKNIEEDDDFVL